MKLGKQLGAIRRELVAHPKKAVVLGILLAAAAWFWGPIVWRKMGGRPATANPAVAAVPAASTAAPEPSAAGATQGGHSEHSTVRWSNLLAARRHDPLTTPATYDRSWPQPFKVQLVAPAPGPGEGVTAHTAVLLTPADAGLVLESVVYGKSGAYSGRLQRAAMINGEIYSEGEQVAVAAGAGEITFRLVEIQRARVSLERYGKSYWLEFARPQVAFSRRANRNERPPQGAFSRGAKDQP